MRMKTSCQTRTCRVQHLCEQLAPGWSCWEEEEGKGLQAIWQQQPSSKRLSHILCFSRKLRDLVHFPQGMGEVRLPAASGAAGISPRAELWKGPGWTIPKTPSVLKTYFVLSQSGSLHALAFWTLISPLRNVFSCDIMDFQERKTHPTKVTAHSLENRSLD